MLSQEAWEAVFDFLMSKHMIFDGIPDDFYHEEIQFKDVHALDEKFEMLEEQNLFSIKHCQEKQSQIEAEYVKAEEIEKV
jgi:hypothetical protein